MLRKLLTSLLLMAFVVMPLQLSYTGSEKFLAADQTVADNTTEVHGTDFTSLERLMAQRASNCAITIWFTPAAGAAVNIEFHFAVSNDAGATYSTDGSYYIAIPTNSRAIGGVVRWTEPFDMSGISHIRLEQIVVGNGAGNCTVINARISY